MAGNHITKINVWKKTHKLLSLASRTFGVSQVALFHQMVTDYLEREGRLKAVEHFIAIQDSEFDGAERKRVELRPSTALPKYDNLSMWGKLERENEDDQEDEV